MTDSNPSLPEKPYPQPVIDSDMEFKGQIAKETYGAGFWRCACASSTPEAALKLFKTKTAGLNEMVKDEVLQAGGTEAEAQHTVLLATFHGIKEKLTKSNVSFNDAETHSLLASAKGEKPALPSEQKEPVTSTMILSTVGNQDSFDRLLILLFQRVRECQKNGHHAEQSPFTPGVSESFKKMVSDSMNTHKNTLDKLR